MITPSPQGLAEAEKQIDLFVQELIAESSRVASRNASEQASAQHVERAATHLFASGTSRVNQVCSTVGGVVTGAAISAAVTYLSAQTINGAAVGVAASFSVAGAVLMTIGLFRRG